MQKKMQNLFNKEEWIILNLNNANYQVKTYLGQLEKLMTKELGVYEAKAKEYKTIFDYYKDHLIPAIQETAKIEKRHIKIFDKNPDTLFDPQIEVQNHQTLTTQFLARFEQLHAEFYKFTKKVMLKVGK